MRALPEQLQIHLQKPTTTLTKCVKLTLESGVVQGFTALDENLVIEDVEYISASFADVSNLSESLEDTSQKANLSMVIDSLSLTEEQLASGTFDNARVEVFIVNYNNIAAGKLIIQSGYIGEVTKNGDEFSAEISPISAKLDVAVGAYYTPTCRALFGDSKCKVSKAAYTFTSAITQVLTPNSFVSTALTHEASYFNYGVLEFTSGVNMGKKFEVADFTSSIIQLTLSPNLPLTEGDSFMITRGCDKFFSTCVNIFNNAKNFRGEPHIPGTDAILKTGAN
jgi:uncharacterized phage protein (TIGR02218 family)